MMCLCGIISQIRLENAGGTNGQKIFINDRCDGKLLSVFGDNGAIIFGAFRRIKAEIGKPVFM